MLGPSLTPRERAVLAAVERRLSNPEIASELFISVRTVESHIASLRRKLGADTRADLVAAARELRESTVRTPPDPLRGRARELTRLGELFATRGQVTIVGPGGVGKTRLALEFARAGSERVPLVVDLEHATPRDVLLRIARTLDLEPARGHNPYDTVAVALSAHEHLLLLDNADHVTTATGETVARLRDRVPHLAVLTTSRMPLGAADEVVMVLEPLATDGVDAPATALLIDRIRAAGGVVDPGEAELAHHIAQRLDGLPLALELAASTSRHLPLAELARRLDHDFATLDRATPEGRHRSLATAFEWTWDLLDDEEQDVLRRLAALPRTFDIDLAVAVTHERVEGAVMRLLDRSLLVPASARPPRWRMLAVMREFVRDRTDPALAREVQARHAHHIDTIAAHFIATARVDDAREAMTTSAILCPEANAALRWTIAERDPHAVSLATSLAIGVEQFGSDVESLQALSLAASDAMLLEQCRPAQLLALGSALAFYDVDLVAGLAGRALAIAADETEHRDAELLAGIAAAYGSDPATAFPHLDRAEELAERTGDRWELGAAKQARGLALCALALRGSGDDALLRKALAAYDEAARAYAHAGDETHVHNVRFMMALTAAETGHDTERAAVWAAESAAYAERIANEHELAHARLAQAKLGVEEDFELADLVDTFRQLGDLRCVHRGLMLLAARTDGAARIAHLEDALAIAEVANDRPRQAAALEQLAAAHERAGDAVAAAIAVDRLAALRTDIDGARASVER